ncbi:uncharacterized protein DNG_03229 [Cephalotrichum gorgonifer]|uniref:RNA-directed DNA polymerase n=1 Tax=Cephalotrichum gorgonifer TaxID=2041049 RepID=A0AAE8MVV0_9PEZI|nr:uncharacterized protein DNG_03229 [Cephalotrichum gorgonifer]
MSGDPALVQVRVNNKLVRALIDTGCDCYAAISESLYKKLKLPLVDRRKRLLRGYADDNETSEAIGVARFSSDISGYLEETYAYVIPGLGEDLFLGKPWCEWNDVVYYASERRLLHRRGGVELRFTSEEEPSRVREIRTARLVTGSVFSAEVRRLRRRRKGNIDAASLVRAISISDIDKALQRRPSADPAATVPLEFRREFPTLFSKEEAKKLPPHRPGSDHEVNLVRDSSGNEAPLPWGPLYDMSREELLVLRKTITDLVDRGFIRASSSAAAAPVLFVKKPGGGLRLCCDYRALNAITKRDRYPLPLITETLRSLSKAKWFTKLDVVAAFHKLRMAKGHEYKTAFRTRFGSFEWMVCPFGLSGAPATFQRYINSAISEFGEWATAYLDDVLIYTDGSRREHMERVRRVLASLEQAGLHLDPAKCEFGVKRVKYLGFIITAGKGVSCDPDKLLAIREWLRPLSATGVRSFLGFANYYRVFIPDFAEVTRPLTALTGKGTLFRWGKEEQAAFEELKRRFIEAPLLKQWDYDHATWLETDCSGFALGGTLSQEDENGTRGVVAYYSRRLTPAEYNYPIHDKEMLAVVSCLKAWRAELQGCGPFTVVCDHKNLEYFMTKRALTERQSRWVDEITPYDFQIKYRKGKLNAAADALSRREQDAPRDSSDEREQGRHLQLIPERAIAGIRKFELREPGASANISPMPQIFEAEPELQALWEEVAESDGEFRTVRAAIQQGARCFPPSLNLKVQISECEIDPLDRVTYRGRLWVPGKQATSTLRGRLIQAIHDSQLGGHPGRDATTQLVGRSFFWPGYAQEVRRFVKNCDKCRGATIWRRAKQGLLKPLPIPERIRSDIAMDFMVGLPPTGSEKATNLLVIHDRLTKSVTLEAMASTEAEASAERFLYCHVRFHGFPKTIVSDRGTNWTSKFWKRLCYLVDTKQLLSTAYHPQTDGGPERVNQEVQKYLRTFVNYAQDDWGRLLPAAQLALNSRESASTKLSPFFLEHGYHASPIQVKEVEDRRYDPKEVDANKLVQRLEEAVQFAQASLAATQTRSEDAANKRRAPAERYEVGDLVWLNVGNYRSPRPSKKLDWLHRKYRVTKVLGSHNVELDVPSGIENHFHVDLLQRASSDPLPGQVTTDPQPTPLRNDEGEEEWAVEEILCARSKRRGRGYTREAFVRWNGFEEPTWEPVSLLADTRALDAFEAKYGAIDTNDGPREQYDFTRRKRSGKSARRERASTSMRPVKRGKKSIRAEATGNRPQRRLTSRTTLDYLAAHALRPPRHLTGKQTN